MYQYGRLIQDIISVKNWFTVLYSFHKALIFSLGSIVFSIKYEQRLE